MATLIPEDTTEETELLDPPTDLWGVRTILRIDALGTIRWAVDKSGGFWYWGDRGGTNFLARSWMGSIGVKTWGSRSYGDPPPPHGPCLYVSGAEAGPKGLQYQAPPAGYLRTPTPTITTPEDLDEFVSDFRAPPKTKPVSLDQDLDGLIQGVKTRKKW